MTLIKNKYDYKEIKKASVEGRRLYACPDGNSVASVTTILDATKDKTHLIAWRKRVGETKAKEITTEAAGVGTRMHKYLEDYVESGEWPGTTDLVGIYNGSPCIMDFKQTNKPKKKEWVEDYYLQLTAYALAHNELYGTNIQEGHVFMCSRDLQYQQFDLWPDDFKHWESKWWDRVYQYYDKHY